MPCCRSWSKPTCGAEAPLPGLSEARRGEAGPDDRTDDEAGDDRRIMTTPSDTYYRLAPGAHVVRLDEGGVLFRTNSLAILIEGASSRWLADRVIPLLDGRRGLAQVAEALPNVEAEELRRHLDALVEFGGSCARRGPSS